MTGAGSPTLRLGFVGLGRYGWAVMRAILRYGQHRLEDISWERFDESSFCDNQVKKQELISNYSALASWLDTRNSCVRHGSAGVPVADLVQAIAPSEDATGVLLLSVNRERGKIVLQEIGSHAAFCKGTLWLLSSISRLSVGDIAATLGDAQNVNVIRYLENMGVREGAGLIAAYAPPHYRQDALDVLQRVFRGIGDIIMLNEETKIDAARVVIGGTIGMIAWYAQELAKAIQTLEIEGLGRDPQEAAEITYRSMAGALALAQAEDIKRGGDLSRGLLVLPGRTGAIGTTACMIRKCCHALMVGDDRPDAEGALAQLLYMAYRECLDTYESDALEM